MARIPTRIKMYVTTHRNNGKRQLQLYLSYLDSITNNSFIDVSFVSNVTVRLPFPTIISNFSRDRFFNHFSTLDIDLEFDNMIKVESAMQDFIDNTLYSWMIRIDDDVGYNWNNLEKLVQYLKRFDPLKEKILLGQPVYNGKSYFLGGGSGVIYSRAAIQYLYPNLSVWVNSIDDNNDIYITKSLLQVFNLKIEDTSIGGLTSEWEPESCKYLMQQKFNELPKCSPVEQIKDLGPFHRVSNVFAYHHYWGDNNFSWNSAISNSPKNVWYYKCTTKCSVCLSDADIEKKFPNFFPNY